MKIYRVMLLFLISSLLLASCSQQGSDTPGSPVLTPATTTTIRPTQILINPIQATEQPGNARVLFTDNDQNLWIWQEAAGVRQLTQSIKITDAVFSPRGDLLIYTRLDADGYSLWSLRSDGTQARELVTPAIFNAFPGSSPTQAAFTSPRDLQWISNQDVLAFTTAHPSPNPDWVYHLDLWVLDVNSGQLQAKIEAGRGGRPVYSPDGSKIALLKTSSISILQADGSNYQPDVLTFTPVTTYQNTQYYPHIKWAPDGSYLIAVIPPANSLMIPIQPTGLWKVPTDKQPATLLKEVTTAPLLWPSISPDASSLAYQAPMENKTGIPITHLMLLDLSDLTETRYYTDQFQFLGWSVDSQHFIFTVSQGGQGSVLGSFIDRPASIQGALIEGFATWVDANRFVFFSRSTTTWDLHMGRVNLSNTLLASIPMVSDQVPQIFGALP